MKKYFFVLCALFMAELCLAEEPSQTADGLRENGAFGFPQKQATVFCDQPTLRFSVWSNHKYLFAQAILWTDDDASLGKTPDNRDIGDWSVLMLDVDADGKPTKDVDRNYMLNPWPGDEGLHYTIVMGPGSTTGIQDDSHGRGAIRYLKTTGGKLVRVDTYLIPLAEISRRTGDKIRLGYWGQSPKPELTVNSTSYVHPGKPYYSHSVPYSMYHEYVIGQGGEIDDTLVPEGRNDISLSTQKKLPMPKVGDNAPEISAKAWINAKASLTLAKLRGKVTVVEFWATWCGPCQEAIPHLNKLQQRYANKNFQLLSLVLEGHETMDPFLARKQVAYPIGLESESLESYGVTGIPWAFVIDVNGKILWEGISSSPDLDEAVAKALGT
ncbi:MAG TPA: TlpA disulfide reductase family protein [Candidatus Acidoferrum sp.]|nr:TlpA disulfide reductase family protein [Candidatus Acidoferrum sp.]